MNLGFDLSFSATDLKAALVVSLLSVWVLVGLFAYLNRYTQRRYFSIWTAAWLFYALWLTLCLSTGSFVEEPLMLMVRQWCLGTSAVFLLWGCVRFLRLPSRARLFGLFMGFLVVWSYVGVYQLDDAFWTQLPVFGMVGAASGVAGWCFWRVRQRRGFIGAGLLASGFVLWGAYLLSYAFLQRSEQLASAAFFASAVLQLFIAVSMIVLVLEEARRNRVRAVAQLQSEQAEAKFLRRRINATEERHRKLFDQAEEGIIIAAKDDLEILECNPAARRLLGLGEAAGKELYLADFLPGELSQSSVPGTGDRCLAYLKERSRVNLGRQDGTSVVAEIESTLIDYGSRPACQFLVRDLTVRSQLEEQVRQAEKLAALGRMMSGVAHELNNPLAVIRGYLDTVVERRSVDSETRADLQKAAREAGRATRLIRGFLMAARQEPSPRELSSLNELVHQVVDLGRFDLAAAQVACQLDLDPRLPLVRIVPEHIQQVVSNLLNNAIQAVRKLDRAARITVRTRQQETLALIEVEDNGPGIPEALSSRIFEPFFTTKSAGVGTGLGLSIAQTLVADHGGRLSHRPAVGGGACFVVELPVEPAATSKAPSTSPGVGSAPRQAAEVLIVDDDPCVAHLLEEMLRMLGYQATWCHSPIRALEVIAQRDFDVVLSDYRMPEMNGGQFFRAATGVRPGLAERIVFMTGDTVSEETCGFLRSTGVPYLGKPFSLASVEQVLARVSSLSRRGETGASGVGAMSPPR